MKITGKFFLLITAIITMQTSSFAQRKNFEYRMLRYAESRRTEKQNSFYKFISKYNNPVSLTGPAALLITGIAQHNNLLKRKSLFGVESIATAEALVFSLKISVGRIRPSKFDSTFTAVVNARNKAFPSGHTAEAFAMATAMSIAVPKWYVIVPAYAWASMIAYARVYLGVHYPTDVIAGAIVGSASTFLMYKINKGLQQTNQDKHPGNEILGTATGLGAAFLIYSINRWLRKENLKKVALKNY